MAPQLRGTGEAAEAPDLQDGQGGAEVLAVAAQLLLLPRDPLHRLRAPAGQPLPHLQVRRRVPAAKVLHGTPHSRTNLRRRPPSPVDASLLLRRAGGARAGGRSTMHQHARLSAQARCHPLRSGAPRSDSKPCFGLGLLITLPCSPVQKPENILIESLTTCKIKVIDYGNAELHHDQRCSYVQSRAYRAPEVVLGLAYDTKVDMWSLGCILMELFTGKLLFDNTSVQVRHTSHATTALMVPYCSVAKHRGTV
eukprot:scaffold2103_cov60-Phaeocystis_antarctica.AAC.4